MARCENCLHFHLCVNMEHQHLRMLLAGDKAERCNYFESKADVAPIADTVQKYKSAIIKYYSKPTYQPTKEHPIKHTQIEYLFLGLDQIAKEMLEGEK